MGDINEIFTGSFYIPSVDGITHNLSLNSDAMAEVLITTPPKKKVHPQFPQTWWMKTIGKTKTSANARNPRYLFSVSMFSVIWYIWSVADHGLSCGQTEKLPSLSMGKLLMKSKNLRVPDGFFAMFFPVANCQRGLLVYSISMQFGSFRYGKSIGDWSNYMG